MEIPSVLFIVRNLIRNFYENKKMFFSSQLVFSWKLHKNKIVTKVETRENTVVPFKWMHLSNKQTTLDEHP